MGFSLFCIAVIAVVSGAHNDIRQMEARTVVYLALSGLLAGVLAQVAHYFAIDASQISKVVLFTAAYPLVTLMRRLWHFANRLHGKNSLLAP